MARRRPGCVPRRRRRAGRRARSAPSASPAASSSTSRRCSSTDPALVVVASVDGEDQRAAPDHLAEVALSNALPLSSAEQDVELRPEPAGHLRVPRVGRRRALALDVRAEPAPIAGCQPVATRARRPRARGTGAPRTSPCASSIDGLATIATSPCRSRPAPQRSAARACARINVRLTPYCCASTSSGSRVPGGSAASTIAERRLRNAGWRGRRGVRQQSQRMHRIRRRVRSARAKRGLETRSLTYAQPITSVYECILRSYTELEVAS